MKDEVKSVLSHLGDRLTSPLFGSFTIAWLIWNHRYFVILFSDLPIETRFSLIERQLYPSWTHILARGLFAPACVALVYLLVYPDLSRFILRVWDRRQKVLLDERHNAQMKVRLTAEQSMKLWSDAREAEKVWSQRIEAQTGEIERLKAELGNAEALCSSAVEHAVSEAKNEWQEKLHAAQLRLSQLENDKLILTNQNKALKNEFDVADKDRSEYLKQLRQLRGETPDFLDSWPEDERRLLEGMLRLAAKAYPKGADYPTIKAHLANSIPNAIERDRFLEKMDEAGLLVTDADGLRLTAKGKQLVLLKKWHKEEVLPPPIIPPAQYR